MELFRTELLLCCFPPSLGQERSDNIANRNMNARLGSFVTRTIVHPMNRVVLLVLATLTSVGSAYAVWLSFNAVDAGLAERVLRVVYALLVIGAGLVTWEALLRQTSQANLRLKRGSLMILAIGIIGLATNAFFGVRSNDPDGPFFVISLLLILQAFLTIGLASRPQ